MTGVAQILGVLISPCLGTKLALKPILVYGTAICTLCMGLVSLFASLEIPMLELVFILLFLIAFQASQGSFFFTYVAEVAEDVGIAWANFTLFTMILIFAMITQMLFDNLGIGTTFLIFAACNLMATLVYIFVLKDISGIDK